MRKREILMIIIGILLVVLITLQLKAMFVYCYYAFYGICPINGCQDAEEAKDCKLINCVRHDGTLFSIDCESQKKI